MTHEDPSIQFGLSDAFLENLDQLARRDGSWWQDVLLRDDVFIAMRNNSLNVYYRGASIFRIDDAGGGRIKALTHIKYLVRQQQVLAELKDDNSFDPSNIGWQTYEGNQTMNDMVRAAADLSGLEKAGLHPLVLGSNKVIDVEISLLRPDAETTDDALPEAAKKSGVKQDRIDVVTLENRLEGVTVVFHEAKHFSNSALRAVAEPKILEQMTRYHDAITRHEKAIADRYEVVCKTLVRLHQMRIDTRKDAGGRPPIDLAQAVRDVAAGTERLQIDPNPRLIVFGFDADQRDGRWERDETKLKQLMPGIKIRAIGNTKSAKDFF